MIVNAFDMIIFWLFLYIYILDSLSMLNGIPKILFRKSSEYEENGTLNSDLTTLPKTTHHNEVYC